MNRLFICSSNKKEYLSLLEKAQLPKLQITDNIYHANILLGESPQIAKYIEKANNLEWAQSTFAGCDSLIALEKRDYQLTNVRGIFGALMSEYVFGYLISFTRHFDHYKDAEKKQSWAPISYSSLANKTITILGTGSIGQHVACTAKHFGMNTLGINKSAKAVGSFDKIWPTADVKEALAQADVVVSILPSTKDTIELLNKENLFACNNAIFFNLGRGAVLVEEDLILAIEQEHIRHAFLDVFVTEPLPSGHPFWTNKKITITPHNSALSFPSSVFGIFVDNYQRFIENQPLKYVVDFEKGY